MDFCHSTEKKKKKTHKTQDSQTPAYLSPLKGVSQHSKMIPNYVWKESVRYTEFYSDRDRQE